MMIQLLSMIYLEIKKYLEYSINDYINITSYVPKKIVYKLVSIGLNKNNIEEELEKEL